MMPSAQICGAPWRMVTNTPALPRSAVYGDRLRTIWRMRDSSDGAPAIQAPPEHFVFGCTDGYYRRDPGGDPITCERCGLPILTMHGGEIGPDSARCGLCIEPKAPAPARRGWVARAADALARWLGLPTRTDESLDRS